MKFTTVFVTFMAASSVSALAIEDSSYLVARANEKETNAAAKEVLKAVSDAAKQKAAAKGKEIMEKKKAELKAKAEASIKDSKEIAHHIFEQLKHHSLLKIKEITAQLLELIKKKIADAVDLGKTKAGEVVDKKKGDIKDAVDKKLHPNSTTNALVAREFDDFDLEERGLLDDAMTHIFVILKRSGLINSIIRQSLVDDQVRHGVASITVELIEADVIPYTEVLTAMKDSGLALDVIKYSLTDSETRAGLIQLIVELIPELIRSGALNPFDYIGGDAIAQAVESSTMAVESSTITAVPTAA